MAVFQWVGSLVAQAAEAASEFLDLLFEFEPCRVDHQSVWVQSFQVVGRQRIKVDSWRKYLKQFSWDQRENSAPATRCMGRYGSVVISAIWAAAVESAADLANLESIRKKDLFSASATDIMRTCAGSWMGTSKVAKSVSGQSAPLKFLCQVMQAMPRRAVRQYFVIRRTHAAQLQLAHQIQHMVTIHRPNLANGHTAHSLPAAPREASNATAAQSPRLAARLNHLWAST